MTPCLYALLAAWAASGPPDQTMIQTVPVEYVEIAPVFEETSSGGLRQRLRSLFGRPARTPTCYPIMPAAEVQPAASPYAVSPYHSSASMPISNTVEESESAEPGVGMSVGESSPPAPATAAPDLLRQLKLAKKDQDRIGHEDDYSWITGHLFYVHTNGGCWILRYALPDQPDRFGGSVVLAPGVEMKNFREGDLVCVYGKVIDQGRPYPNLGGALYRVDTITMVERADP
jgi:hypothetical protein